MNNFSRFATLWGGQATLLLTLTLCGVTGLLTPYILALIGLVLMLATAADGSLRAACREPAVRALAAIFVVLAACFIITAQRPQDALLAFNFGMLVLFAGFFAALSGLRSENASRHVARLALAGTLLCFVVAVLIIFAFGLGRRGYGLLGVIRLSNTAVLLGFLALVGLVVERSRWRLAYLLAPLLGIATIFITGSRGPLLAIVPLALIGAIFLVRTLKLRWPVVAGMSVAGLGAVAVAVVLFGGRIARLPKIVETMIAGGAISDRTTVSRLDLYQGAWHAFQQSPIVGHGWAHLMTAVTPFLADPKLARLPQLHNDIADFAVAAGAIGLLCYVALLVVPVAAAVASPRDRQYGIRVFGCLVLSVAYFCDGMTDLMFGFEFHTALYAGLVAILLAYCRDRADAEA